MLLAIGNRVGTGPGSVGAMRVRVPSYFHEPHVKTPKIRTPISGCTRSGYGPGPQT